MKRFILALSLAIVFGFAVFANATLIDRGGGLIYDDDLNITWLQNANYVETMGYDDLLYGVDNGGALTWTDAMTWSSNLTYYDTVRGVTYDDWRLPTIVVGLLDYGYEGDPDGDGFYNYTLGYNLANSEMGHLYYEELGNKGYQATDGTSPQTGWGLSNTAPFINLQHYYYWSGTEYAPSPTNAFCFDFREGLQDAGDKGLYYYAWAVRPGDVGAAPVPEPATIVLLIVGLGGVIGMTKLGQRHG